MRLPALALAAAAAFAAPAPVLAADDSLALQPAATTTGPGGTVEIQVLARLFPGGKAVIPVRASDVALTAKGGGTVAPASEAPGEVKWIYRAPENLVASLDVTIEGKVRSYPDASGSCALRVNIPAPPAPAGATAGKPGKAAADEDGDLLDGEKAEAADPVGKLVTLEEWKARAAEEEPWKERDLPAKGEALVAPGQFHQFRFRVNLPKVASVELRCWRDDAPNRVRLLSEKNHHLDVDRDQDGLLHGTVRKQFEKVHAEYTMCFVIRTEDGKVLKENLTFRRGKPEKDEKGGKGDGKK